MMNPKKKLLWVSDLHFSGFGNVARMLLTELGKCDLYEISVLAVNCPLTQENMQKCVSIELPFVKNTWTNQLTDDMFDSRTISHIVMRNQIFGIYDLIKISEVYQPDIFFCLNDLLCNKYLDLKSYFPNTKFICYVPLDIGNTPPNLYDCMDNFDKIITITKFSKSELEKGLKCYLSKSSVYVLYHPLSFEKFFPLYDRKNDSENVKNKLRKIWNMEEDYFVLLNVNKNQKRKRLDLTIKLFDVFWKNHKNSILIIKSDLTSSSNSFDTGIDIGEHIETLYPYLAKNIIVISQLLTRAELNELYNLSDVFMTTTLGEGWGYTPCEAILSGTPVLVPNHTSYMELFDDDQKYEVFNRASSLGDNKNATDEDLFLYAYLQRKVKTDEQNVWIDQFEDNVKPCILIHKDADENKNDPHSDELSYIKFGKIELRTVGQFKTISSAINFLNTFLNETNHNIIHVCVQAGNNYDFLRNTVSPYLTKFIINNGKFKINQVKSYAMMGAFVENYIPDLNSALTKLESIYANPPYEITYKKRDWFMSKCNCEYICRQLIEIIDE